MKALTKAGLASLSLVGLLAVGVLNPLSDRYRQRLQTLASIHLEQRSLSRILHFPEAHPDHAAQLQHLYPTAPTASHPSGFYPQPFSLHLTSLDPHTVVRYTLDGSLPTHHSPRYQTPLTLTQATTLRFRSFRTNRLPSPTITHHYWIGDRSHLPILAIAMDPNGLADPHLGIYQQFREKGSLWQRQASFEYLRPQQQPASQFTWPGLVQIHGKTSRRNPKKSWRLTYDPSHLQASGINSVRPVHPLLPPGAMGWANFPGITQRTLVLRNGGSEPDWTIALRNQLFDRLYRQVGGVVAPSEWVNLSINGQFWGIYQLYDHLNPDFLTQTFGPGDYELLKVWLCSRADHKQGVPACYRAMRGSLAHWNQTQDFFRASNPQSPRFLAEAERWVDGDNLIDYVVFHLYNGNTDWPFNNAYFFRRLGRGHPSEMGQVNRRWRWIAWDQDGGFLDSEIDSLSNLMRPDPPRNKRNRNTIVIQRLLENPSFRQRFVRRLCDRLNFTLQPEAVEARLDQILAEVGADRSLENQRWQPTVSQDVSERRIEQIRRFARDRPSVLRKLVQRQWNLGPSQRLRLANSPPEGGRLKVNQIPLPPAPSQTRPQSSAAPPTAAAAWEGEYFSGLPLTITAEPAEGYTFVGWSDSPQQSNPQQSNPQITVTLTPLMDRQFTARYRKISFP